MDDVETLSSAAALRTLEMDLDTPGTMRTTEKKIRRRDVYSYWHSFCLLVVCCAPAFADSVAKQMDIPLGLPQIESAADNFKAQPGERLFFDKRLSVDRQVSGADSNCSGGVPIALAVIPSASTGVY